MISGLRVQLVGKIFVGFVFKLFFESKSDAVVCRAMWNTNFLHSTREQNWTTFLVMKYLIIIGIKFNKCKTLQSYFSLVYNYDGYMVLGIEKNCKAKILTITPCFASLV